MSQKDETKPDESKWQKISENAENQDENTVDEPINADVTNIKAQTDRINILEKEIKDQKDQALRMHAEWENTRRRLERDVSNAHKYGAERLISELLPVMDSLTRALENKIDDHAHIQTIRHGIELTIEMLSNVLKKHGILEITPKAGDIFDPAQHEAMSMQAVPDTKSNTVLQVLQKGYALNGRIVRAAMVIVSA